MRKFIFFIFCIVYGVSYSQVNSYTDSALNAQELYKMKKYAAALLSYERTKKIQSAVKMSAAERAKLDRELAQSAYRTQDYTKASEYFQSALQAESNMMKRSELFRNLGNTAMQLKNIDEAIDFYKKGVKLNQNDAELKYNLSQALREKAQSSKSNNKNNDQGGKDGPMQLKSTEPDNAQNQVKPYSFEDEQKRRILNDLLRKEAETKRRIKKKQSTPSTNGKDWK
tara:strand:+ start:6 stop:683 length:678 start_codon:yes stop_codon:yes gene_type:complete